MRALLSNLSEFLAKLEDIGFVEGSTHQYHWNGSDGYLYVDVTGSSTTIKYVSSGGTSTVLYALSGAETAANPIVLMEWFLLDGGGIAMRFALKPHGSSSSPSFSTSLLLAFLGDGTAICRDYNTSGNPIVYNSGTTNITLKLINPSSAMSSTSDNIVQIGKLYNQTDGFIDGPVMNVILCPSTLSHQNSYAFSVGDNQYVMGMSTSTSTSGSSNVGNRLCFKLAE